MSNNPTRSDIDNGTCCMHVHANITPGKGWRCDCPCHQQKWPEGAMDDMEMRAQLINDFNTLKVKYDLLLKQFNILVQLNHYRHSEEIALGLCENNICKEINKTLELIK